jgi:hypothetical protein
LNFLLKKDGAWDWDDFISIRLSDPKTEQIRKLCANLPEQFPPSGSGQYCNEEGMEFLRKLVKELREK